SGPPIPDLSWVGESIAQRLRDDLLAQDLAIVPRPETREALESLHLPWGARLTDASALELARKLGVDRVVLGTYTVAGASPIEAALLVHGRSLDRIHLTVGQPMEVRGSLAGLLNLEARLSWRALAALDPGKAAQFSTELDDQQFLDSADP